MDGELLWVLVVETEAYSQEEPACHGHRRRTPSNETLFGEPGRFYVYVSYSIHHCVKRVTSSHAFPQIPRLLEEPPFATDSIHCLSCNWRLV